MSIATASAAPASFKKQVAVPRKLWKPYHSSFRVAALSDCLVVPRGHKANFRHNAIELI